MTWVAPRNPNVSSCVISKPAARIADPAVKACEARVLQGGKGSRGRTSYVPVEALKGNAPKGTCAHAGPLAARNRRSRRLLLTTKTDENPMAAPASSGLSMPTAARGSAATL